MNYQTTEQNILPQQPLSTEECKVVEAAIQAIVSVFTEANRAGEEWCGNNADHAIDVLAAVACQVIRRTSPLPTVSEEE